MSEKKLNKLKVITTFYNPGKFLDNCVASIFTQNYENYEVLFIDDCSTDDSYKKIPAPTYKVDEKGEVIHDENGEIIILEVPPILQRTKCVKSHLWRASSRATALPNLHQAIMNFCTDPDDIVTIVDGDDWLFDRHVLSYVNDYYNENDCWMMYGSSKWTDGRSCCSSAYKPEEYNYLRDLSRVPFRVSHLRTFKAGLYHKIAEQDPEFACMKDDNGEWYDYAYDVPLCTPLLEMAGPDKVKHNEKILYVYNRDNPISEDKINQKRQTGVHLEVLKKKPFKRIENYK